MFSRFLLYGLRVLSPHPDESAAFDVTDHCLWLFDSGAPCLLHSSHDSGCIFVSLRCFSLLSSPLTVGHRHQPSFIFMLPGAVIQSQGCTPYLCHTIPSTPDLVSLARTFSLNSGLNLLSFLMSHVCCKNMSKIELLSHHTLPPVVCSSHKFSSTFFRPITL